MTTINQMHYIDIPINYDDIRDIDYFKSESEFKNKLTEKYSELLLNIKVKYPDIELKFGDFIENGYESGYRCNGVYIVNKTKKGVLFIDSLSIDLDDYGTLPENFISFEYFEPGYHFQMKRSDECTSYMHNNYIPISLLFLRKQNWIKKDKQKECEILYEEKKYLVIRKNKKYLIKFNNKIIYGKIYLKNRNSFDSYDLCSKDNLEEGNMEYQNYDGIIFI